MWVKLWNYQINLHKCVASQIPWNSPWCWSPWWLMFLHPPDNKGGFNYLWTAQASELGNGWVQVAAFWGDLSWLVGMGLHLWQCLREGGRGNPASSSPVILILLLLLLLLPTFTTWRPPRSPPSSPDRLLPFLRFASLSTKLPHCLLERGSLYVKETLEKFTLTTHQLPLASLVLHIHLRIIVLENPTVEPAIY